MRILALDTSTEWCSVDVGVAGAWLERSEPGGALRRLRRWSMRRWPRPNGRRSDAIASARPRSFTGIRIGCAVAQGARVRARSPLLGVPTLEAIAVADGSDDVLCCLDARMREVYVAASPDRGTDRGGGTGRAPTGQGPAPRGHAGRAALDGCRPRLRRLRRSRAASGIGAGPCRRLADGHSDRDAGFATAAGGRRCAGRRGAAAVRPPPRRADDRRACAGAVLS
jgi:hypothetical protein